MINPLMYMRKNDKKIFVVTECYYSNVTKKVECIVLSRNGEYIDVNNNKNKEYDFEINESEFKSNFRKVRWYEMWLYQLQVKWRSFKRRRR